MSEELKTLKDLNICSDCILEGNHVHIKELKAESIKWIKEWSKSEMLDNWIKHFFNLTEEDLTD